MAQDTVVYEAYPASVLKAMEGTCGREWRPRRAHIWSKSNTGVPFHTHSPAWCHQECQDLRFPDSFAIVRGRLALWFRRWRPLTGFPAPRKEVLPDA